ncbi:MAG: TonB-dependent receptor [Bacteroidota bacterium]
MIKLLLLVFSRCNIIAITICALLGFINVYAQTTFTGLVQDENGEPIGYANILIKGTTSGTTSDVRGNFSFPNIFPGKYTLEVSAVGFKKASQNVAVGQDGETSVKVILDASALELETITVMAEKREDELQKVPIPVTAVDAKKIESLQINNINELGRITPNFLTYDDGAAWFPLISTRGIITIDATPIVGVYIDDVPLFNISSFPSFLNDMERIEILKGPQGTLYGRNSIGGVINILSKSPTNELKGYASAGFGNLSQYDFQTGISAPLIKNKLFVRVNGGITGRNGYVTNTFDDRELLGREFYAGNLRLKFIPNSGWLFSLSSGFESRENQATAFVGNFGIPSGYLNSVRVNHPYEVRQNDNGVYNVNTYNNAFKVSYTARRFQVDAITALQITDTRRMNDDLDFTEFSLQTAVLGDNDINTLSQEIRISSNDDSRLEWIGGAYFYLVNNKSFSILESGPDNLFFVTDSATAAQYPFSRINDNEIRQDGFSLFGQLSFAITDRLKIVGGLRYELENSSLEEDLRYEKDGQDYEYPLLGAVPASFDLSTQFDAVSPKLNISYQANPNTLLYANVARGYRPGGVNPFVADDEQAVFDPEFSWNYEVGTKNKLWNNRARLNASAFYITYTGQQLFTIVDLSTFAFGKENLGSSHSYGVEVESEFIVVKGLNLRSNIGYLETEFTDFTYFGFSGNEIDNEGNAQVMSPRWNGNIGLNYNLKLSEKWQSNLSLDYQYTSEVFFDAENLHSQPGYGLLNGRMVVGNKNLELAIWAQNLTDVTYLGYGFGIGGSGANASYSLPRTFGTTLTAKL